MGQDLSVTDLARRWNRTGARVRQLIESGQLPARRMTFGWLISESDVERLERERPQKEGASRSKK